MIRKGTERDARAVAALESAVFSDAWREEDILRHTVASHLSLLVWEEEGRVLGYLLGACIPPEGEIYRVATDPAYRGRGGGEALCRAFLAACGVCYLEVRRSNTPARTLYEKLGFSLVGERKKYYKDPDEDACLYRKEEKNANSGL